MIMNIPKLVTLLFKGALIYQLELLNLLFDLRIPDNSLTGQGEFPNSTDIVNNKKTSC